MALMLGQLYDALKAGAAEEVANYEGEIAQLRVEVQRDQIRCASAQVDDGLCARIPGSQLLLAVPLVRPS
jgi:hypothetical protein